MLAGVAVAVLMLLFPPWQRVNPGYSSIIKGGSYSRPSSGPAGYGFLFYPPSGAQTVDLSRLAVQFGLVGAVTFGLYVLLGHKKED